MNFDSILKHIGEFGRYQQIQLCLVSIVAIISAFLSLNMVFVGGRPDHHCLITEDTMGQLNNATGKNLTYEEYVNLMIPMQLKPGDKTGKKVRSECFINNVDAVLGYIDYYGYSNSQNMSSSVELNKTMSTCSNGWTFDKDRFGSTIVSEWDLVCDRKWLKDLSKSLFFAGRLCGAVTFGALSDKFGRRPIFLSTLLMQIIAGVAAALSVNMYMFFVAYFIQGMMQVGVFLTAYVMGTELVGPSYRKLSGFLIQGLYSVGFMVLPGVAYLVKNWRHLELAISLPAVLFLSYYWFVPESVRWLLNNGKIEEAKVIVTKAMKVNKIQNLDLSMLENVELKKEQDNTQRPTTTKVHYVFLSVVGFNIFLNWMINALVYYGLSLNSENIGGNVYINAFLQGAVEIPAYILCMLLLDRIGRKWLLIITMVFGGVCCIVCAFIPTDPDKVIATVTLASLGKLGITASYGIIYLWSTEIFPTEIRNAGMGISSMCSRIGGILAPFFLLSGEAWGPLPLVLFGTLAAVAAGLAFFLPETLGKPMPEWIADMKQTFRKNVSVNETDGKDQKEDDTSAL